MFRTIRPRRFRRGQRGMEALQTVLILAVGCFIILGLRQVYFRVMAPGLEAQAGVLLAANGRAADTGGGPPAQVLARSARTLAAQSAPANPPVVARAAAPAPPAGAAAPPPALALTTQSGPGGLGMVLRRAGTTAARTRDLMTRLGERYTVTRVTVPGAGVEAAVLTPTDPADKRVVVLLGEPGDWDDLPAGPAETRAAADGPAGRAYATALDLARGLAADVGAENLTVVGVGAGGRLATYAGAMLGVRAVGYDTPPLDPPAAEDVRQNGVPASRWAITQFVVGTEPPAPDDDAPPGTAVALADGADTGLREVALDHLLRDVPTGP